jgi:uncharacterized protein YdhG (YjbR/CyaY superfamily)
MPTPTTVDAYLDACPEWARIALEEIRAAIRRVAPDATETISYQMPAFRDATGRMLVSYAAFADHCSLFPLNGTVLAALGPDARRYLAGKGTMRFDRGEPLPVELVERVVAVRLEENAAKGPRKR